MTVSNLEQGQNTRIFIGYSEKMNGRWLPSTLHREHTALDRWKQCQNEYAVNFCAEPVATLLEAQNIEIARDYASTFKSQSQGYFLWLESIYRQQTILHSQNFRAHNYWPELMEKHGEDIRKGIAFLILSQVKKISESPNGDILKNQWFEYFHQHLEHYAIPAQQVVVLFPIPEIAEIYNTFCKEQKILEHDRIRGVSYINYYEIGWLQCARKHQQNNNFLEVSQIQNNLNQIRPHKFLCFNNEARFHRKAFYSWLKNNNQMTDGLVSFLNSYLDQTFDKTLQVPFREEKNKALLENFSEYEKDLPQVVDVREVHITDYAPWPYRDSYYSIITERVFNSSPGWTLPTAKIYKTIHNLHPFIILGQPGLLKELRRQGFHTFPEWFDESYDEVQCPDRRFQKVCSEVERINQWNLTEIHQAYQKIFPKLLENRRILESHNKHSAWHDEFHQISQIIS